MFSGKKILLGISGGIAAYKTAFLVRLLIKSGAQVKVVMTPEAKDFITPLTLSTLSKNPVYSSFTNTAGEQWNNHVELAKWADFMCMAPLTANTLSKMVEGHSDNLLLATYLSLDCPVYIAPAMDLDMYQHPTTQNNLEKIKGFGHQVIASESGELASGLTGKGRMAEPENICAFIEKSIKSKLKLYGKKVLITAGPTYEAIDPVRFIGNHSSGKMGYALAECAVKNGAEVILVSGPTALQLSSKAVQVIDVTTADEMYETVHHFFSQVDVVISAAAVSDYKPYKIAKEKIKKSEETLTLRLRKNRDILHSIGAKKRRQIVVGFAMETEKEVEHARAKLHKKNLDFIVLNSLRDKGAGFKADTNKVKIIDENQVKDFELKPKLEVAQDIVSFISDKLQDQNKS